MMTYACHMFQYFTRSSKNHPKLTRSSVGYKTVTFSEYLFIYVSNSSYTDHKSFNMMWFGIGTIVEVSGLAALTVAIISLYSKIVSMETQGIIGVMYFASIVDANNLHECHSILNLYICAVLMLMQEQNVCMALVFHSIKLHEKIVRLLFKKLA